MQDGKTRQPVGVRPWRTIAEELAAETNPDKVLELSLELDRALEHGMWNSPDLFQDGRAPAKKETKDMR